MDYLEIIFAVLAAVVTGVLFFYLFKTTGPWGKFWSFMLILILVGLVAAAWSPEVGPQYYGVSWLPTLFIIFFFAIFLAAATPPRSETDLEPGQLPEEPTEKAAVAVFGVFFWFFIVMLIVAAIVGFAYYY